MNNDPVLERFAELTIEKSSHKEAFLALLEESNLSEKDYLACFSALYHIMKDGQ